MIRRQQGVIFEAYTVKNANNMPSRISLLLILISLWMASCVPARKYDEVKQRNETMKSEMESQRARALEAEAAANEQQAELDDLRKRNGSLVRDTAVLGTSLRQMTTQYDKINKLNNELLDKYNKMLEGDRSENRQLLSTLEELRLNLQNQEDSLDVLSARLQAKSADLAEREKRMNELQDELAKKDKAMKDLKDRVSAALTGFEGKGLTIEQRDGKLYVSLENKLLFSSGSATVDAKGKKALTDLAKAIENDNDISITVEGHTDTDKIGGGSQYKDNWDLSVARATSVVRILQSNSSIDPKRITAAGRSEFAPVDPKNKAANRRIEVILTPDLKALYNMVSD